MPSWGNNFFNHDNTQNEPTPSPSYETPHNDFNSYASTDSYSTPEPTFTPEPEASTTVETTTTSVENPTVETQPSENTEQVDDSNKSDETAANHTHKTTQRIPRLKETSAKAIVEVLDAMNTDDGIRIARTILGVTSPSKASLLTAASKIHDRGIPKMEQPVAKRIVNAVEALDTSEGIAVAKVFTGSNSPNKATLLSALTETKIRRRVAEAFTQIGKINEWSHEELMMNLALGFAKDKNLSKLVFGILNAAAPDRGFGRPSGDESRDAKTIAEHWGDGVDLSSLNALRL